MKNSSLGHFFPTRPERLVYERQKKLDQSQAICVGPSRSAQNAGCARRMRVHFQADDGSRLCCHGLNLAETSQQMPERNRPLRHAPLGKTLIMSSRSRQLSAWFRRSRRNFLARQNRVKTGSIQRNCGDLRCRGDREGSRHFLSTSNMG